MFDIVFKPHNLKEGFTLNIKKRFLLLSCITQFSFLQEHKSQKSVL